MITERRKFPDFLPALILDSAVKTLHHNLIVFYLSLPAEVFLGHFYTDFRI